MEKPDKKIIVALAVGLAGAFLSAMLFWAFTKNTGAKNERVVEIRVLEAARDIPAGVEVGPEDVRYTTIASSKLSSQHIVDEVQIQGAKTSRAIKAKEILTRDHFQMISPTSIPQGYVAMSLKIDSVSGVSWLLKNSDLVDVVGVVRSTGKEGNLMVSSVVLQALRVIFVNAPEGAAKGKGGGTGTVTLLMKPEESQKLLLLATSGEYSLALRGANDETLYQIDPVSIRDIARIKPAPKSNKPAEAAKSKPVIDVVEVK